MPEPYWPKRKKSLTLLDAHKSGILLRAFCAYDKRERYFLPVDLAKLYGDIECDDVMYLMKCRCGRSLDVGTAYPSAQEKQTMTIRRLKRVYYERRTVWQDVPYAEVKIREG